MDWTSRRPATRQGRFAAVWDWPGRGDRGRWAFRPPETPKPCLDGTDREFSASFDHQARATLSFSLPLSFPT
jgi:hypothetical protein